MGEYHALYLKTNVLLLGDVFEKFISDFFKDYGLDPLHCISSPGLSWDTMLKMTGIQLEKTNNIDVHLFLEKGMRGGVSYISKRYSKSDQNTEIMYWDANNLFGWAMIQDLPYCGFKFLTREEIENFDLNISENSPIRYILEVDLEYCKELHDVIVIILCVLKKLRLVMIYCQSIVKIMLIGKLVVLKNWFQI